MIEPLREAEALIAMQRFCAQELQLRAEGSSLLLPYEKKSFTARLQAFGQSNVSEPSSLTQEVPELLARYYLFHDPQVQELPQAQRMEEAEKRLETWLRTVFAMMQKDKKPKEIRLDPGYSLPVYGIQQNYVRRLHAAVLAGPFPTGTAWERHAADRLDRTGVSEQGTASWSQIHAMLCRFAKQRLAEDRREDPVRCADALLLFGVYYEEACAQIRERRANAGLPAEAEKPHILCTLKRMESVLGCSTTNGGTYGVETLLNCFADLIAWDFLERKDPFANPRLTWCIRWDVLFEACPPEPEETPQDVLTPLYSGYRIGYDDFYGIKAEHVNALSGRFFRIRQEGLRCTMERVPEEITEQELLAAVREIWRENREQVAKNKSNSHTLKVGGKGVCKVEIPGKDFPLWCARLYTLLRCMRLDTVQSACAPWHPAAWLGSEKGLDFIREEAEISKELQSGKSS